MAANTTPIFGLTANIKAQTFVAADTTTKKDIFIAGSNGSLLRAGGAVSDDTALVNLDLWYHDGSTAWAIGTIQVAIGAGNTVNTAAINLLNTTNIKLLMAPDGSLFMATGTKLQASVRATVTAAKTCTVVCAGVDY